MQSEKDEPGEVFARHPITPGDDIERELLHRYIARKYSDIERIEGAVASEDFALIHRIGHNLAGSGAAYGFVRISAIGQDIEAAAGSEAAARIASSLAELRQYLDSVEIE